MALSAAAKFARFAKEQTSSPHFSQANGEAERAVKTIKQLLQKAEDPYQALLIYRATPLHNGYSPAELLMNRRLGTTLPVVRSQLKPSLPNNTTLREKEERDENHQKDYFDAFTELLVWSHWNLEMKCG